MITKGLSKYILKFQLKQHTPIIHFQTKQSGATLRGSEFKPKLDRFLKRCFQDNEINYKQYLISGEKDAFDYQIKIIDKCQYEKYYIFSFLSKNQKLALKDSNIKFIAPSLYFAQEKEYKYLFDVQKDEDNQLIKDEKGKKLYTVNLHELNKIDKYGLFPVENGCLTIKILSRNFNMLESIKENIYSFFAKDNFGTRQNKGFGSYSIKEDNNYEENLKNIYPIVYKYEQDSNTLEKSFFTIKNDYSLLKSGLNFGKYKKSLLFLYFVTRDNPIRWEKRKFKVALNRWIRNQDNKVFLASKRNNSTNSYNSCIYDQDGNQNWFDKNNYNYKYIRLLLGLSDKFEFKSSSRNNNSDYTVKLKNIDIDRYKSPITFKVFNNTIYLVAESVNVKILNAQFTVNIFLGDDEIDIDNISPIISISGFDIDDFLDFAFNRSKEKIPNWKCIKRSQS